MFQKTKRSLILVGINSLICVAAAPCFGQRILTEGKNFKDEQGRTLILRGVNLAGSSKTPFTPTHDQAAVSFVGRPFPLAEADEHFKRLRSWGLTFERLIVPWEAVEHAGPGQYDAAYLDYLHAVVAKARSYGISVFIDPHSDGFSRAFGGDGAPYWASSAIGLIPDKNTETGVPESRFDGYGSPSGSQHATNTMLTLFFAGNDFAPGLQIYGTAVQDFLQDHFINSVCQVAVKLADLDNVVGYDLDNEPSSGYIGDSSLQKPSAMMALVDELTGNSRAPISSWDVIQAASGYKPSGTQSIAVNSLWRENAEDIWRKYGVWGVIDGVPTLLKPNYFSTIAGKPVSFDPYLKAFQSKEVAKLRAVSPRALIFQELTTSGAGNKSMALGISGVVSEPHWYEVTALLSKHYTPDTTYGFIGDMGKPITGHDAVFEAVVGQIRKLELQGQTLNGIPTLLGEVGIAFDMNGKEAYRNGDFHAQESLASIQYGALDRLMMSYTIWNYSPDNTNAAGDHWNGEDLSIFSSDQRRDVKDINSGGRALSQTIRPYPMATAGKPVTFSFDEKTRTFQYVFEADPMVAAPTEIFVPALQYPSGLKVVVQGASYKIDSAHSLLIVSGAKGQVTVIVTPQ